MNSLIYSIFLWKLLSIFVLTEAKEYYLHPDTGLNISQLLARHGYPFEAHTVQTTDGYILGLHRIPHGLEKPKNDAVKPAVLLVHGMGSQSTDFVNSDERSLGLLLADRGYDVWLLNTRGNTHSRKHVTLDPDKNKKKFWDFSFHELGVYDLPNTIDYILELTNQESLFYIGHSQGTTAFFVMGSVLPEYNKKIKLMSALGPSTFSAHLIEDFRFKLLSKFRKELEAVSFVLQLYEIFPHDDRYVEVIKAFCLEGMPTYDLCAVIYELSAGYSPTEMNMTLLPVHASNSPSGFSAKQGFHYLQGTDNGGHFRQYDHGSIINMIKYGSPQPPDYNLTNIACPVTLHYAIEDQVVNHKDVEHLYTFLPNATLRQVPMQHFTHIDFIFGNHMKTLVFDYIFEEMEKYL